jgi:arylsulfatase A-like enzyme
VCSPSRASILTGKHPPHHGITDYIGAPSGEDWRRLDRHTPLLPAEYERGLRPSEITFAKVLRQSGYRTFFAGKWHLGGEGSTPEDHGFEINKGGFAAGSPPGGYFSPYDNPVLDDGEPGENLPIRLAEETTRFIEAIQVLPFLAYLSFYSVHAPIQTRQELWAKYRQKATAGQQPDQRFIFDRRLPVRQVQDCPIYAGMIEAMDNAVGLVLDTLDRLDLAEDTIVVFTSDNGGVSSGDAYSSSMLPLRGGKGRQWEGGIREPVYFRYPAVVQAGTECEVPVSGMDFYPTFMELAATSVPDEQLVDGTSMVPLLEGGNSEDLDNRDLFWHYPHYGNQGGEPSSIIRRGEWKLIHYYEDERDELYNLAEDPGEQNDVQAQGKDRAQQLRRRLDAWLKEVDAKLPEPDPQYDSEKHKERLHHLKSELMPRLEEQHARYLDPDWEPNEDWWGSQVTTD